MYVTKYKDKYRAFERYKVSGKWKKVSVVMEKNTPQERRKAAEALEKKADTPRSKLTYSELVKDYINWQKATMKASTWSRNEASLKRLTETFNDAVLSDITAGFIQSRLLAKTQNPGTYNEYLKRLKAMFRWAYRYDYIDSPDCVEKIKPLKDTPEKVKIKDKYLEADELKEVLAEASDYYSPIFEFLALSGLRIGELIALNNSDVTETDILVNKTYDFRNGVLNTPKTFAGNRTVHVQPELLSSIRRIRANSLIYSFRNGNRSPYFAVNPYGGRLSYDAANREFKTVCERVTGKSLTLHALRHTHVALMAEKGIDLKVIARRLGHSSSRITEDIYYHCTAKQREKDNAAIDAVRIFG